MRRSLLLLLALLVIVGLACQQAGEILSEEEATARAQEGIFRPDNEGGSAAGAEFAPGSTATVIGSGFLINLVDVPGGRIAGSQSRGSVVEIIESADFEDEIWYHVDSQTGDGWLKAENLEPIEEEEEVTTEGESDSTTSGPAAGDTVYLVSNGFLINLLREPNGQIQAVQERGVQVVIEDVFETDAGETWYLINAPTGEGWVSTDNISLEAP
jgi:hypothetical protein